MVGSSSTSTLGLAPFKALTTWVTPGMPLHLSVRLSSSE